MFLAFFFQAQHFVALILKVDILWVVLIGHRSFVDSFKETRLRFLILILSIVFSFSLGGFAFLRGWESLYRGVLRFFGPALSLPSLSFLLPRIFGTIGHLSQIRKKMFVQIKRRQKLEIRPIKHWLFRPFQGIGIGLLFATKAAWSSSDRHRDQRPTASVTHAPRGSFNRDGCWLSQESRFSSPSSYPRSGLLMTWESGTLTEKIMKSK